VQIYTDVNRRKQMAETENGNTKHSQSSQRKNWFFTWNNYPADARELLSELKPFAKKLVFQSEKGKETETPHIQGVVELLKPMRYTEFKWLPKTIHWEATRNAGAAVGYCLKDDTYTGDIRVEYPSQRAAERMRGMRLEYLNAKLNPWQTEVEKILHGPVDPRKIYWFWEPTGNVGKSFFMKYMYIKYPDQVLPITSGKTADILTVANEETELYIFDFARCNDTDFLPYNAFECLKNGMISDGKLKKKMEIKVFPKPHIICFANAPPHLDKMSEDKWAIYNLQEYITNL